MHVKFRLAALTFLAAVFFPSAFPPGAALAQEQAPQTRLAQADEGPMVISPQPHDGQYSPPSSYDPGGPGRPYEPALDSDLPPAPGDEPYISPQRQSRGTFSMEEIKAAGHRFFGNVSMGLAQAIEYAFQRAGRPNGYVLGEEAGGALIAGVRYGDGVLYTKDAGQHRLYWQGPSVGYDFGAEGSKTMVLVYDLQSPSEIYSTFVGVDGSAYLVGGVGVTFLARSHVILAPIRSGLGLRLGANVGYLKYTREPTWNPF
jgi:hypothetical protein